MEGRGCAAGGEESAFDFLEAVGGFWASVVGRIGAGFYFPQFSRGGGAEEVARACLARLLDGVGGDIFGCHILAHLSMCYYVTLIISSKWYLYLSDIHQ
jgi:hypothetical protein